VTGVVLVTKDSFIVIADDDWDDREFIRDALVRNEFSGGFECMEDGRKLLDYLKQPGQLSTPGLIVLDLNMPQKDGYEALAEIKQDPELRNIPTVVLTSSTREEDESRCYGLGCDGYFQKPMSLQEYDHLAAKILDFMPPGTV
jgi:CheY-like chemotaxis protein